MIRHMFLHHSFQIYNPRSLIRVIQYQFHYTINIQLHKFHCFNLHDTLH